jgi:hypothetical protein
MSWFTTDDNRSFRVTGTTQGWFGRKTVRTTVTGKRAARREAARLHRRGATNVRVSRDGWWAW